MKKLIYLNSIVLLWSSCRDLTNPGQPSPPEKDYFIAYNIHIPDTTKDDWEVMIMNADGSDKRNLTQHDDVAWTYYAYRDKLYLISDRDTCYRCFFLYETDSSGMSMRKVSDLRLEDSWMSSRNNGEEMVVTGRLGTETRFQLFIVNTESGHFTQITADTAARFGDPCFSPDGSRIVYAFKKNKRDRNSHEELFIMNADGSGSRQLTHYPEENPSAREPGYKAGAPRWHPTEHFISYISFQDGRHQICAVSPDGSRQWKITTGPKGEGWHDWSPDGKWLTYDSSDPDGRQYHIMLMNWKTKEMKQLTDSTYKSQLAPVFVSKL